MNNRLQNLRRLGQRQSNIASPLVAETKSSAGRYHAFPPARRRVAMPCPPRSDRRHIRLRRESTNLNPPRIPARPNPAVAPDSLAAKQSEHHTAPRDQPAPVPPDSVDARFEHPESRKPRRTTRGRNVARSRSHPPFAIRHRTRHPRRWEWIPARSLRSRARLNAASSRSPLRRRASGRPLNNASCEWSSRGPHLGPPPSPRDTHYRPAGKRSGGLARDVIRAPVCTPSGRFFQYLFTILEIT